MNPFGRKKNKTSKPTVAVKQKKIPSVDETAKPPIKKLPGFFSQFSEKQINLIYSMTNIKRLVPQELLFKKEQKEPFLSIILEGQINISSARLSASRLFGPGSILGAREFFENTAFKSSAYANTPAVIMSLEKNALAMLDSQIKEILYAEIIKMHSKRAEDMEINNSANTHKISSLGKSLYTARTSQIYDYEKSELILNIIKKIPKLPAFTHTLSTKLLDNEASAKEIISLIRQDPALVADVLKTVNSSYYGLEQKVSDINSAVLLLGFQSLYQLIMSEGIRKSMPDTPNFKEIHNHALAVSYIAFSLSMSSKIGVPVQMATIGLLHNMGESVVSLLLQRNPNLSVFINSLDRPSLGAFLLEEWNFPKTISQAVKYQSYPEFTDPSNIPDDILTHVAILHISQMCYEVIRGASEEDLPLVYFEEYKKILKLNRLSLEEISRRHVVADLKKRQDALPVSLKNIINPQQSY